MDKGFTDRHRRGGNRAINFSNNLSYYYNRGGILCRGNNLVPVWHRAGGNGDIPVQGIAACAYRPWGIGNNSLKSCHGIPARYCHGSSMAVSPCAAIWWHSQHNIWYLVQKEKGILRCR